MRPTPHRRRTKWAESRTQASVQCELRTVAWQSQRLANGYNMSQAKLQQDLLHELQHTVTAILNSTEGMSVPPTAKASLTQSNSTPPPITWTVEKLKGQQMPPVTKNQFCRKLRVTEAQAEVPGITPRSA